MSVNINSIDSKYSIKELIYYVFFALMLTAKGIGLGLDFGQKLYLLVLFVAFGLIIIKEMITKHSLLEWIFIVGIVALSILIYVHTDEIGILVIVPTILGMKDVSPKRTLNLGCFLWAITFGLTMIVSLLGLRSDVIRVQDKLGLGYIIRWSLGQPHPNVLQISALVLCAFILYIGAFKGRKLLVATFLMLLFNFYIFMYSISYTGIALAVMYLLLNLYFSMTSDRKMYIWEKVISVAIIPMCIVFSIAGPLVIKGRLFELIDKAVNTRFKIAREYMTHNPVSLLGSGYCDLIEHSMNNLDCSYVFALMHYGIIIFILLFAAYIGLVVHLVKEEKRSELAIVLAMSIAAITEPFFVNSSFKNITLIILGEYVYLVFGWINEKLKSNNGTKVLGTSFSLIHKNIFDYGKKEVKLEIVSRIENLLKVLGESIKRNAKVIVPLAIGVGCVAAVLFATFAKMPEGYYVFRDSVQIFDPGVKLDISNLPTDFNYKILQYLDNEKPMYLVDGGAVTLEYVRGIVSMFFWCMLGIIGGLGAGFSIMNRKTEVR